MGTDWTTHVSAEDPVRIPKEQLTLYHDILTSLLVALAAAADSVGEAITLMVELLTLLTCGDVLRQLALKLMDQ